MADTEDPESEQTSTPRDRLSDDAGDPTDRAFAFFERAIQLNERLLATFERATVALERIAAATELAATAPTPLPPTDLHRVRGELLTVEAERQLRDPTRSGPDAALRQAEDLTRRPRPPVAATTDRIPRGFTPDGKPIY